MDLQGIATIFGTVATVISTFLQWQTARRELATKVQGPPDWPALNEHTKSVNRAVLKTFGIGLLCTTLLVGVIGISEAFKRQDVEMIETTAYRGERKPAYPNPIHAQPIQVKDKSVLTQSITHLIPKGCTPLRAWHQVSVDYPPEGLETPSAQPFLYSAYAEVRGEELLLTVASRSNVEHGYAYIQVFVLCDKA